VVPLTIIYARAIGPDDHDRFRETGSQDYCVATKTLIQRVPEAAEMPPNRSLMLRRFFQDYKQLEGKSVEVTKFSRQARPTRSSRTRFIATVRAAIRVQGSEIMTDRLSRTREDALDLENLNRAADTLNAGIEDVLEYQALEGPERKILAVITIHNKVYRFT